MRWIAGRKFRVNAKQGYIHMQDVNTSALLRFENTYVLEYRGCRFNRAGDFVRLFRSEDKLFDVFTSRRLQVEYDLTPLVS